MDVGISGAKERRPELDRLLAECRKRRVDAVVVYRYDRFARSLRQLVNALCEFDALRIQFVSLHEGVDTSTPNGRLVFGIFASIAEFERELIRDRVRSGMAAARARGARIGRPRKPVDADKVAELRAQGASWRMIARELGVGVGTVRNCGQKSQRVARLWRCILPAQLWDPLIWPVQSLRTVPKTIRWPSLQVVEISGTVSPDFRVPESGDS